MPTYEPLDDESTVHPHAENTKWKKAKARATYYIPILKWLPEYNIRNLPLDLFAGISVSMMMIPQGLSYAALAGVDPTYGLFTCLVPVLVYGIFGTSRQMSVGPEAVVAIIAGSAAISDDQDEHTSSILVLTLLVGVIALGLGLCRLGFIDNVLSRPLVEGFILGSAFMILSEQFAGLFGYKSTLHEDSTTIDKFQELFSKFSEFHGETTKYGVASFFVLIGHHIAKQKLPMLKFVPIILLVVIGSTVVSWQLDAVGSHVRILGELKSGFYTPKFPEVTTERMNGLISTAAIIVIVGFVEATAISKRYANKYNYMVSANRELVALGTANILGSVFGAFPCFASLPRSNVNDMSGARTQLHNIIVFVMSVVTIRFFLPLFRNLPKASMAAIVSMAAISLIHFHQIRYLMEVRAMKDLAMLIIVFIITISLGVTTGIIIGIALSLLQVISYTAVPKLTLLGKLPNSNKFGALSPLAPTEPIDGVLIIKIDEPLYFANTGQLKDSLRRIELLGDAHAHPSAEQVVNHVRCVIFDVRDMSGVDASAVQILHEIVEGYHVRTIKVAFVKLQDVAKPLFRMSGLTKLVGPDHFFEDMARAEEVMSNEPADESHGESAL